MAYWQLDKKRFNWLFDGLLAAGVSYHNDSFLVWSPAESQIGTARRNYGKAD